jgi:hypothetical protein
VPGSRSANIANTKLMANRVGASQQLADPGAEPLAKFGRRSIPRLRNGNPTNAELDLPLVSPPHGITMPWMAFPAMPMRT